MNIINQQTELQIRAGLIPQPTYHVVAIFSDCYKTLAQSRGTFEEALHLFLHVHFNRRSMFIILRDGSSGERISIAQAKKMLGLSCWYNGEYHRD